MAKDKYDFIQEMLANAKLTSSQKEKILLFSLHELREDSSQIFKRLNKLEFSNLGDFEILKRIEELEISIETIKSEQNNNELSQENRIISLSNPKHVADFMSLFNQREGLKYLTHDYDESSEFDIDQFLRSANNVFVEYTRKLNIPTSLWRIVKQFAFDSKQTAWTSISSDYKSFVPIKIGWATKELREWSKKNKLHPIRNEEYEKIITDFKKITRIESPNLEKLINQTIEETFKSDIVSFNIDKIDLQKADFYSHVGFLKKAFEAIFEEIKKRSDSPDKKRITIKYERAISDDGYYIREVKILHHQSYPEKELKLILDEWHHKGNMGKIKQNLIGYCHWSVETLIEGSGQRVNILRENHVAAYEATENNVEGFTHILTFYYK